MRRHRVAIAGFGNVGRAVAQLVSNPSSGAHEVSVVAVSDQRFGTVVDPDGVDAAALVDAATGDGSFENLTGYMDGDVLDMITKTDADTLVELTFTDLTTGEPATTHIRTALQAGMNVSTTNKGPVALHLDELEALAAEHGATLAYEGTVMSGTPVLLVAEHSIRDAGFRSAVGILNGTTNYIVTRMEEGVDYDEALVEAQDKGYAEADPSGDVDGHDAAGKLAILSKVILGRTLDPEDVARTSLASLAGVTVREAVATGHRWKYVATLDATGSASVEPRKLDATHPLAAIGGATNAITFDTDLLGTVSLVGPGAGRTETAYAVVSDLHQIALRA